MISRLIYRDLIGFVVWSNWIFRVYVFVDLKRIGIVKKHLCLFTFAFDLWCLYVDVCLIVLKTGPLLHTKCLLISTRKVAPLLKISL